MALELDSELKKTEDYEEKLSVLRRFTSLETYRIGINDLSGELGEGLGAEEVSLQLTSLAEVMIEAALETALAEVVRRYGEPADRRFFIMGLGKLGGMELSYGSDLDVIFVYAGTEKNADSEEGKEDKKVTDHEFFVRLAQKIISVLTIRTKEGIAFEVDTRLRPSGSAGPLVVSIESLYGYHRERASAWERQSIVKARAVAGDLGFGKEVVETLSDIIYSRGLKCEESEELLRIRRRMETEIAKETPKRVDVKVGKGALVDIEFLVQALQLRNGANSRELRTPRTMEAIDRLGNAGCLSADELKLLKDAYVFYRRIESGLRITHGSTTCTLSLADEDAAGLRTLARIAGYKKEDGGKTLFDKYVSTSERIRELYLEKIRC